jgi:hypothetical protein
MKKILLTFSILAITSCSTVNGYLVSEKKKVGLMELELAILVHHHLFHF